MEVSPIFNLDMKNSNHFTVSEIEGMEKRFRTNLINSITGFKSLNLCATISEKGQTNLAIMNSVVHIGSDPALIGMIIRPETVPRHTLKNLLDTGQYTLNHVNKKIYKRAHQTSARHPEHISEFLTTKLHEQYTDKLRAPYVLESNIKFGLELKEKIDIKANGTVMIIGAIVELFVPNDIMEADGFIRIDKAGTVAGSGLEAYYRTHLLARLPYAKAYKKS